MTGSDSVGVDNGVGASDLLVEYSTPAGPITALDLPELTIAGGTSLAIMGASGCGKSTLLGLLGGLARPTRGIVTVGSVVVSGLGDSAQVRYRRSSVGMVYQADNLLPHLTVEENVALPLAVASIADQDAVARLLRRLDMLDLARRFPDQLSGGQRQRVAVARAVVGHPRLILADEPTGSLDADNARRVVDLLVESARRIAATLVVVTHNGDVASRMDRVDQLSNPALSPLPAHAC